MVSHSHRGAKMTYKLGVTDFQYFSDCRRQWWLGRLWEPLRPNSNFWVGSAIHAGLEEFYEHRDPDSAQDKMQEWINKSFIDFSDRYSFTWETFYDEFVRLGELAQGMLQNYFLYEETEPVGEEVVATEQRIEIPLYEDYKLGMIKLVGRIDLLVMREGELWVVDHKTTASLSGNAGLDVDEQLTGYAFLVHRKLKKNVAGVLYNSLVKDLPAEPRILKDGSLSKDVSQKTTYDLYMSEINRRELNPEDYSTILNLLRAIGWKKFFQRDGSTRNNEELQSYYHRVLRKAQDIAGILRDPVKNAYPSPQTLRCSGCPFLGVCKSMEDGGDWEAILNSKYLPKKL
jgi:hypothetical protein